MYVVSILLPHILASGVAFGEWLGADSARSLIALAILMTLVMFGVVAWNRATR